MKLFICNHCGHTVYFENATCEACGHALGYLARENHMVALKPDGDAFRSVAVPKNRYRYCDNARYGACNWLVDAKPNGDLFCLACRHNDTVPDLSDPVNLTRFQVIERAKKRLFYSLLRLGLPLETRAENPAHGLAFRFLADFSDGTAPVMTGHEDGIITIALVEADDAERERRRTDMGEPYRTLLGHLRHEIGHHYWDLLVDTDAERDGYRALFGDESQDYSAALQRHYTQGPPPGWQQSFVSSYATAHPWEDFAETWAHFIHITDTLETAATFNLETAPKADDTLAAEVHFDPYRAGSAHQLVTSWVPVAALVNSLNRSMGTPDAYPFVLSEPVTAKLDYMLGLCGRARANGRAARAN
jgi:hypothetical protein